MKEREFWRSRTSGHLYAVELEDGIVTGSCGPLTGSEIEERFLTAFDYSAQDADWLEEHREQFDFYGNGVRRRQSPPLLKRAAKASSSLGARTVGDAMHPGVITCLPRASLRDVARIMSSSRVHAVVVWGDEEDDSEGIWGLVSDLDLVAAAAQGSPTARSAVGVAGTPAVTVRETDTLQHASELMSQNGVSHLVVLGDGVEHPAGILSTLDIARAVSELD
ncbi:MAG: CBS domain-containing protein [Gaiellaceae bacterium]